MVARFGCNILTSKQQVLEKCRVMTAHYFCAFAAYYDCVRPIKASIWISDEVTDGQSWGESRSNISEPNEPAAVFVTFCVCLQEGMDHQVRFRRPRLGQGVRPDPTSARAPPRSSLRRIRGALVTSENLFRIDSIYLPFFSGRNGSTYLYQTQQQRFSGCFLSLFYNQ